MGQGCGPDGEARAGFLHTHDLKKCTISHGHSTLLKFYLLCSEREVEHQLNLNFSAPENLKLQVPWQSIHLLQRLCTNTQNVKVPPPQSNINHHKRDIWINLLPPAWGRKVYIFHHSSQNAKCEAEAALQAMRSAP